MVSSSPGIIPVYTTRGDAAAFLAYPHLFNPNGEWVGWVAASREVYSVLGFYVGYLTNDPRVLRKRSDPSRPRLQPPARPGRINIPARIAHRARRIVLHLPAHWPWQQPWQTLFDRIHAPPPAG